MHALCLTLAKVKTHLGHHSVGPGRYTFEVYDYSNIIEEAFNLELNI